MNLHELHDKFAPNTSKILLEFSPGKMESLKTHFHNKNPSTTPDAIEYAVNRYSELLNANDPTGRPVIPDRDGLRDIDMLIAKNGGNGWQELLEIVLDNTLPTRLPESITKIPGGVSLIIDQGGIKVYRTETHAKCIAIRDVIFEIPAFKAVYDDLYDVQKTHHGRHPFGWCVTFPTTQYNTYRTEEGSRSFYFVLDLNRPVTDRWCISVIQPRERYPDNPYITDMKNSNDTPSNNPTTWDFIYGLYPILLNYPKLPYDVMHHTEKANAQLIDVNYVSLPNEKTKKDPYVYRWYMSNRKKAIPIDRFLTLGREYQDFYISSRAYGMYQGNPNNRPDWRNGPLFLKPNSIGDLTLSESIGQLRAANKLGLIRNIVAQYSQNINDYTLEIDSDGLPIVTAQGQLVIVNDPIIIERLPTSRKYIYGKLIKSGRDKFTPFIYHIIKPDIKVSIEPDILTDPADKAVYDEVVKVLQALVLFYLNKLI